MGTVLSRWSFEGHCYGGHPDQSEGGSEVTKRAADSKGRLSGSQRPAPGQLQRQSFLFIGQAINFEGSATRHRRMRWNLEPSNRHGIRQQRGNQEKGNPSSPTVLTVSR